MIRNFWRRLNFLATRDANFDDLEEEMRLHVELRAGRLAAQGVPAHEAGHAAQKRFGNSMRLKEDSREAWGWTHLDRIGQDLRYAFRILRRSPVFTLAAIVTLALGIGANTAIFTLIDSLLLKPLPVRDPARLIQLTDHFGPGDAQESQSGDFCYPMLSAVTEQSRTVRGFFVWGDPTFHTGSGVAGENRQGAAVTGETYSTLGISARSGRLLRPSDDAPGAPLAAVLSDDFWNGKYHRDPSAIGQTLLIERRPFTIIGVTPRGFRGLTVGSVPQITISMSAFAGLFPERHLLTDVNSWTVFIFGALRPGISIQQAQTELRTISPQVVTRVFSDPGAASELGKRLRLDVASAASGNHWQVEAYRLPLFALIGVAGAVLLIACLNLANLLLARASARRREISVRLALGAARARLIRQLMTESFLLLAAGAAAGSVLSRWLTTVSANFLGLSVDVSPDPRVLLFLCALTAATGLLFGLVPALTGTDLKASDALKNLRIGLGPRRFGASRLLVCVQIALSTVLLAGAVMFVRTFHNLQVKDLGFNREDLMFMELKSERSGMNPAQLAAFHREILAGVRAIPSVVSASIAAQVPLQGSFSYADLSAAIWPHLNKPERTLYQHRVAPDYLKTMGIPLLAGRDLTEADSAATNPTPALLNEFAARTYFPGASPVGKLLRVIPGQEYRIVGLVRDAAYYEMREAPPRTVYTAAAYFNPTLKAVAMAGNSWNLLVRAHRDTGAIAAAVRKLVGQTKRDVVVDNATAFDELVKDLLETERLVAILASLFAGLAALLAAVGLYGVAGYNVVLRTSEIGVRNALGATQREVLWMIMKDSLILAGIGLVIGVPAALAGGRLISSMLYQVAPEDPVTIALSVLGLLAVAAVAAFLPARLASKLDPMTALRWE